MELSLRELDRALANRNERQQTVQLMDKRRATTAKICGAWGWCYHCHYESNCPATPL